MRTPTVSVGIRGGHGGPLMFPSSWAAMAKLSEVAAKAAGATTTAAAAVVAAAASAKAAAATSTAASAKALTAIVAQQPPVVVYNTTPYDVVILHGNGDDDTRRAQAAIEFDAMRIHGGVAKSVARVQTKIPVRHDWGTSAARSYCVSCGLAVRNRGCCGCQQRLCRKCFRMHVTEAKEQQACPPIPDGTVVLSSEMPDSQSALVSLVLDQRGESARVVRKCCLDMSLTVPSVAHCSFKSVLRLDDVGERPEAFFSTPAGVSRCPLLPSAASPVGEVRRVLYAVDMLSDPQSEEYDASRHRSTVRHLVDLGKAQGFLAISADPSLMAAASPGAARSQDTPAATCQPGCCRTGGRDGAWIDRDPDNADANPDQDEHSLVQAIFSPALVARGVVGAVGTGVSMLPGSAAALELQALSQAARCVSSVASYTGFIGAGVVLAGEMSAILYRRSAGSMHNRTLGRLATGASIRGAANAALCGLVFVPVAGLPLAIAGGIVVNLADWRWKWSDGLAEWIVPLGTEEEWSSVSKAREELISAAAELLNFDMPKRNSDEERSEAKRRLRGMLRKCMLQIHPDKNCGRKHIHFDTMLKAFAILYQALEEQATDAQELLTLFDGALDNIQPPPS